MGSLALFRAALMLLFEEDVVGKDVGESRIKSWIVDKSAAVDSGFAPGPMKPSPPALEISRARWGPDMTRMGAPIMYGALSHGNVLERWCMDLRAAMIFCSMGIPGLVMLNYVQVLVFGL